MLTTVFPNKKLFEMASARAASAKPLTFEYWRIICGGPANKVGLFEATPSDLNDREI